MEGDCYDLTTRNGMIFSVNSSAKAPRIKMQYFHEIRANLPDFAPNDPYSPHYLLILGNKKKSRQNSFKGTAELLLSGIKR